MMMITVFVLGGVVILITVGLLALMFMKSNQIGAEDKAPLFTEDKGEQLASPFAEQIEDILRAKLDADPSLKNFKVDLGTDKNGGLEIWVDDKKYSNADEIPNEALKKAFLESVKEWESKK